MKLWEKSVWNNFLEGRRISLRKGKEDNITEILKLIAPGTPIRDGLENILRARTRSFIINNRQ